jgi:hypothetical protein
MKSPQISITIYGRDARLLEARRWVLESCGYRVLTAMCLADLDRIPLTPPVSLLVLCHTLSSKERSAAVAHATARWPDVKKLVLVRDSSRTATGILKQVRQSLDGAARLLATVSELVGHAASSSYSHIY